MERVVFDKNIQIRKLYEHLSNNQLNSNEISLYHALLFIAEDANFPPWLSVPLVRLEKFTGMGRDAIYKARDKLTEEGFINCIKGKGAQAAQYQVIVFTEETNLYIEPEIEEQEETVEDGPRETIAGQPAVNIFRKMQEIIPFPPSADIEKIRRSLEEGTEDKLLCEGVDITLTAEAVEGKPPMEKWKYFRGILRTWQNNGIRTYEEYLEHERERRERMENGGNRQSSRNEQPEVRQPTESGIRPFRIPE